MSDKLIVFLSANPLTTTRLDILAEYAAVRRGLVRNPQWWDQLEIIPEWSLDDDLVGELRSRHPRVLHFSGHGGREGTFVIQPARGEAMETDALATAGYLRSIAEPRVQLVVLNVCHGARLAQRLVDAPSDQAERSAAVPAPAGATRDFSSSPERREDEPRPPEKIDGPDSIDVAIGMEGVLTDVAAVAFARSLYQALAAGRSIASAFHLASARTTAEYPGGAYPRLFHRPEIDPAAIYLEPPKARPLIRPFLWSTAACTAFFIAMVIFVQTTEPSLLFEKPKTATLAGIAFVLWLFFTPVFMLVKFISLGRRRASSS